jgi:hypothetical protein
MKCAILPPRNHIEDQHCPAAAPGSSAVCAVGGDKI